MSDLISRKPIFLFFLACFIVSILFLGWLLLPFLSILVLGAVVGGLFYPVYRKMAMHPRIKPQAASLTTCVLIFFVLFVPIVFFIGSLTQQAYGLYQMARSAAISEQINSLLQDTRILEKANAYVADYNIELTGDELKNAASEVAKFVGLYLYDQARSIASNTLAFVINFFLMLMVIYFLLIDGEKLVAYIIDLSPLPSDQENMLILKFNQMASAILVGNGFGGLIQGVAGGMLFWVFGFQSAFLWGSSWACWLFCPSSVSAWYSCPQRFICS